MISSAYRWVIGIVWVVLICVTTIVCSVFAKSGAYERFFKAMVRGLFRVLVIPVRVRGLEALAFAAGRAAAVGRKAAARRDGSSSATT